MLGDRFGISGSQLLKAVSAGSPLHPAVYRHVLSPPRHKFRFAFQRPKLTFPKSSRFLSPGSQLFAGLLSLELLSAPQVFLFSFEMTSAVVLQRVLSVITSTVKGHSEEAVMENC